MEHLLKTAREHAPCVILFDEIDKFLGEQHEGAEHAALGDFQTWFGDIIAVIKL